MGHPWRTIISDTVAERSTATLRATLVDGGGVAIPRVDMSAVALTLCVRTTGAILNTVDGMNVLDAGIGQLDATSGLLTLTLRPEDNVLANDDLAQEEHVALIEYEWEGGTKAGKHEVVFTVANLAKVP